VKAVEISKLLNLSKDGPGFVRWLAQYLVMRLVSSYPKMQPRLISLLNSLDNQKLNEHVKEETFRNVKVTSIFDVELLSGNSSK